MFWHPDLETQIYWDNLPDPVADPVAGHVEGYVLRFGNTADLQGEIFTEDTDHLYDQSMLSIICQEDDDAD